MFFRLYNPDEVTMSFGGIQIAGYASDEFVRIEKAAVDFIDVVGVYGEATRLKTKDARATVTFALMQDSISNDLLSIMYNLDRLVPNGAGVGALLIQNKRAIYRASKAWIARAPDVILDRVPTTREWSISCENLIRYDGGG